MPVPSTAPGKMEEGPGPDTPHSAQNLKAPQVTPQSRPSEHRRILWPADNKESEWHRFDEDVDSALEVTAKVDVDQRLKTMSMFIISIASDRFGIKEHRATKTTTAAPIPNRREIKISQLRQELRMLRSQYRKASDDKKEALAELRGAVKVTHLPTCRVAQEEGQGEGPQAQCLHRKSIWICQEAAGRETQWSALMPGGRHQRSLKEHL